jgi:predicted transcriptional regulator
MKVPIRRPEQILAYRSLREIIGSDSRQIWSVKPSDSVLTALQLMAEKDIGFVVVVDGVALVGVLSERDCVRRVLIAGKAPDAIPVSEIMVRDVVTVDLAYTFADCLRLMHSHRIRHLPVMNGNTLVAVISVRDLLGEAVEYHRKVIDELERERLTIFTSTA